MSNDAAPRFGERVTLRITAAGLAFIDRLAGDTGAKRSKIIRAMLTTATLHENDVRARIGKD